MFFTKMFLYVSARSGRIDKATTLNTYAHIYAKKKAEGGRNNKALESFGFENTRPHQARSDSVTT